MSPRFFTDWKVRRAAFAASALLLSLASWAQAPAAASAPAPAPMRITYPSSELSNDSRGDFYVSLLKLSLSKADIPFDVQPALNTSGIMRAFVRMAAGQGVDVMWAPATPQLDQGFLRIHVPLDKGILGWRIFLINRKDLNSFAAVHTLEQLKAFPAGQVTEWADTDILRSNGLSVVESMQYKDLFKMLAVQRFQYLPRGIGEIQAEARIYADLGLTIEPRLAVHYPMCAYFFVARDKVDLARHLETGLRRALKDGSYEKLFQQFNGQAIQAARLDRRTVFELDNPIAPQGPDSGQSECRDSSATLRRAK
ncbi:MAG TPA: hypothetical protein VGM81_11065 [Burkholderiaceae bacterium]|jgi:hypothetical protein